MVPLELSCVMPLDQPLHRISMAVAFICDPVCVRCGDETTGTELHLMSLSPPNHLITASSQGLRFINGATAVLNVISCVRFKCLSLIT